MDSRKAMTDVALIGVFAALICVLTFASVPLPGNPVPITLQTLAVALAGLCLGPWRGFLATALYLVIGFAGLPVFAGGTSGVGVLAKASAGYLLAFPFAAGLIGFVSYAFLRRAGKRLAWLVPAMIVAALIGSIVVVHPLGIAGLIRNAHVSFGKAFGIDMAFWIGDLVKSTVAGLVAATVHKAFPALAGRRAATVAAVPLPTLR